MRCLNDFDLHRKDASVKIRFYKTCLEQPLSLTPEISETVGLGERPWLFGGLGNNTIER